MSKRDGGKVIGYRRVSTLDQTTARQLDGLPLDKVFEDKASGKDTERPALQQMLDYVREGDEVVVHSLDRLARNLVDLRRIVDELTAKGVRVRFVKEQLVFTNDKADPLAVLMLSVMGSFAEFERNLIRERQREGIAIAKAKGKYRGRKQALSGERIAELRARVAAGKESKVAIAKEFGVSRETLRKYLHATL